MPPPPDRLRPIEINIQNIQSCLNCPLYNLSNRLGHSLKIRTRLVCNRSTAEPWSSSAPLLKFFGRPDLGLCVGPIEER